MFTTEEARAWLDRQAQPHTLSPDELAHYGVLGMKWGVRKDRTAREARKPLTAKRKKAIVAGVTIAIGAATVGALLATGRLRNMKVSQTLNTNVKAIESGEKFVANLFKQNSLKLPGNGAGLAWFKDIDTVREQTHDLGKVKELIELLGKFEKSGSFDTALWRKVTGLGI